MPALLVYQVCALEGATGGGDVGATVASAGAGVGVGDAVGAAVGLGMGDGAGLAVGFGVGEAVGFGVGLTEAESVAAGAMVATADALRLDELHAASARPMAARNAKRKRIEGCLVWLLQGEIDLEPFRLHLIKAIRRRAMRANGELVEISLGDFD